MAKSYSPPDVIVTQKTRVASAPRVQPTLPVVIVGPARQIAVQGLAGTYTAGEEIELALPNIASGAIVDSTTLDVLLDAKDDNGKAIGLFRLASGTEFESFNSGASIRLFSSIGLEYSLLSSNNNDLDTTNNVTSSATPDGINLTDSVVDFLSRGAVVGSTFVNVTAPASAVGRYKVMDLIQSNGAVHGVVLQKVNAGSSTPELSAAFTIHSDSGGAPLRSQLTTYGFPAGHVQGTAPYGTKTSETTATYTATTGIGIESVMFSSVASDWTSICLPGGITMPSNTSVAAVWFQPGTGSTGTGRDNATWKSIVSTAVAGHWLRFVGTMGTSGTNIWDFEVVAVDRINGRLQLQNPDGISGDSSTHSLVAADVTNVYLLSVIKGSDDAANVAGDYVVGATGAGVPIQQEIRRATPYLLEYRAALPALGTTTTAITVYRGIRERGVAVTYDLTKQLTGGFTGNVLVSYEATRTDLSVNGLMDIANEQDIVDKIGLIDPSNPLALGAFQVGSAGLFSTGTVFYALATDGSDAESFTASLTALEASELPYYIVPLTQDPAILSLFDQHVTTQSLPENKHERRVFRSGTMQTVDPVWPLTSATTMPQGSVDNTVRTKFNSSAIDWSLVTAGQMLHIMPSADFAGTPVVSLRIKTVNVSGGFVTLFDAIPSTVTGSVYFKIATYPRSKREMAELWRDEAAAIGNARVQFVRPDAVVVNYTNKRGTAPVAATALVGAEYACAAVAGFKASLVPQQPITNMVVPGLASLVHSGGYWTPDELNIIASGGNFILHQPTTSSPVVVRHQLTTDRTTVQTQELSYQVIADYIAKTMREGLRPYLGKHNITREYLIQLRAVTETLIRGLIRDGVCLEGTILEVFQQNVDNPDEVDIAINCAIPLPCNRINVTLFV